MSLFSNQWGKIFAWIIYHLQNISNKYDFDIKDPIKKIPKKALEIILYGGKESFKVCPKSARYVVHFIGTVDILHQGSQHKLETKLKANIFWA